MLEQINVDLKESMLARDQLKTEVLKSLKTAIKNAEVSNKSELSEEQTITALRRCAKQRQESADAYQQAGDNEKRDKELAEKAIIESYLPAMLDEDKLTAVIDSVISANPAANQGQIMGQVMSQLKGEQVDGSLVARLVSAKLQT